MPAVDADDLRVRVPQEHLMPEGRGLGVTQTTSLALGQPPADIQPSLRGPGETSLPLSASAQTIGRLCR
jgi:hypothetical protein